MFAETKQLVKLLATKTLTAIIIYIAVNLIDMIW